MKRIDALRTFFAPTPGAILMGTRGALYAIFLFVCVTSDAIAGFGGPSNPNSQHPVDACNVSVPPGPTFTKPVDLGTVNSTTCSLYAQLYTNSTETAHWNSCSLESHVWDGYAGATWATVNTDGEFVIVRNTRRRGRVRFDEFLGICYMRM